MSSDSFEPLSDVGSVELFNDILAKFKIKAICTSHEQVRNISLFTLKLYAGTKISMLERFSTELALALHAKNRLTFTPIMETGMVRVEVVDETKHRVNLIEELKTKVVPAGELQIYLGSSVDGKDIWMDIAKNPHLLIGGTTGSGKSVMLHSILTNLLLLSNATAFIVDTKAVEFEPYRAKYPNLSIAGSYDQAYETLIYLTNEMEFRYSKMRESGKQKSSFAPYVLMVDEFADLIMQDIEDRLYNLICSLAQKSRAAGIYCVLATQRPSVDIIRGTIKANLPARIACKVANKTSSRVILDQNGAELLNGHGDAIISNYEHDFIRFQGAFTSPNDLLKSNLTPNDFTYDVSESNLR